MKSYKLWLSRRQFISTVSLAITSLVLTPWQLKAGESVMLRKTIPGTAESLPVIGLGSWLTFDVNTDAPVIADFVTLMQDFFARGGELIDSSPMYCSAVQIIGLLLDKADMRDRVFAATKVWTDGEQAGIQQMERSAQKWGDNHLI